MRKNGPRWLATMLLAGLTVPLPAQDTGAVTRISVSAREAVFLVDGRSFTGAAVFTWPAGSKHTLEIPAVQYSAWPKTRYVFQAWSTSSGPLPTPSNFVTITAGGIPWYNADLAIEYAVSLNFFRCETPPCASPGTVWVNEAAYQQDADVWTEAGSTVSLLAVPGAGFVFAGWAQGGPAAALYSLVVNQATTVYPRFTVARGVTLLTSPDNLEVLADRAPVGSPATLEWGWNTVHTVGVLSPQWDRVGRLWMFRSWSDGGAVNHAYEVPPGAAPVELVAQFVRAVPVLIETAPAGLSVAVDGGEAAAPRNLFWAAGDPHSVSAPALQVDAAGAPWVFRSWSSGGANPLAIRVTETQVDSGIRLTAAYDPLSRLRVDSIPSGLVLSVAGADCRTPCEVERPVGDTVELSAPAAISAGDGVRLDLLGWEGTGSTAVMMTAGYHKITARYGTSYRLTASSDPADAATWRFSPPTADGFYAAGTVVNVAVDPAAGMRFRAWGLDLNGTANPAPLAMDGPRAVLAWFDRRPEPPPPPSVANAAGQTGTDAVAPGSIASLLGTDLATDTAEATTDPLPQTLAGATLRCAGHLLPLLFVSPQQINFQVPSDLEPGAYQLQLLRSGAAMVRVEFQVARNAPGLFLAAHADGVPVTPEAPAAPGERIVLYGTGFGPLTPPPPDGFRLQTAPLPALVDPVEILVADRVLAPDATTVIAGTLGLQSVAIRIPDDLGGAAPAAISVRAGEVESNRLALPLR